MLILEANGSIFKKLFQVLQGEKIYKQRKKYFICDQDMRIFKGSNSYLISQFEGDGGPRSTVHTIEIKCSLQKETILNNP